MWTALTQFDGIRAALRRRTLVGGVLAAGGRLRSEPASTLRRAAHALAWQARAELPSEQLIVEGFALVREAARRVHGQEHFPTQLAAGVVLASGGLAEMQTGEGKTLSALLPTFLHALAGRGCHVVTANDYLAQRDARFAGAVFDLLGLRVGCIAGDLPQDQRGAQYACDVTYGAAREFGFDFLRDRLAQDPLEMPGPTPARNADGRGAAPCQQRARYFALVDEADSVLIDDARTPLIIAIGDEPARQEIEFYDWCHRAVNALDSTRDMRIDGPKKSIRLTQEGCRRVVNLGRLPAWEAATLDRVLHQVEQSLAAHFLLRRDRDYVLCDDGVGLVDASTGRVSAGRKWRGGLQQAVEVKEQLPPTSATSVAAKISIQSFFRGYEFLAGLTGTARLCAAEFKKVYGLTVTDIPTRKPCLRTAVPPRIFASRGAKLAAVAAEVAKRLQRGQAVLVGTPSVEASEQLSQVLRTHDIAHGVLNCLLHEQEAEIIRMAGHSGRVTVATNMAGRGTDIVVSPEVRAAGGLHVIATEMHASPRIDRQLVGRTARQGDPGSYQYFLSLEDELFTSYESSAFARARQRAQKSPDAELPAAWIRWFRRAQRRLVAVHERERSELLRSEREREKTYRDWGLDPVLDSLE